MVRWALAQKINLSVFHYRPVDVFRRMLAVEGRGVVEEAHRARKEKPMQKKPNDCSRAKRRNWYTD